MYCTVHWCITNERLIMEELLDRCSRLKSGYDTGEIWYKAIIIHSLPHNYGISVQQYESET